MGCHSQACTLETAYCLQGMSNLEKPVAAGDTTGDQAALSLTVASQHLRVDLCADAATAPDAVPEERLLQDAAACVELTDLQVLTTLQKHSRITLLLCDMQYKSAVITFCMR